MLPLNGANINKFSIMRRYLYIIIGFALCLSACSQSETEQLLCDVETYIMERPDSALKVLEGMDRSVLESEKERAHYCLLLSMALDKNWIDVASDSLTRIAVSYYEDHEPRQNYARALYYNGLTYFYQEDYENAIIEFTKAEDVASECDSLYWGMIKIAQADTYDKIFNDVEELSCLEEAYRVLKYVEPTYYKDVALCRLASQYANVENYKCSDSLYGYLFELNDLSPNLRVHAMMDCAYVKSIREPSDIEGALNLYDTIIKGGNGGTMTNKDYWAYAYALAMSGNLSSSNEIVSQLVKLDTTVNASYWQYKFSLLKGDSANALSFLENATRQHNMSVVTALNQSLTSAQRNHYALLLEVSKEETQTRKFVLWLVVVSSVFTIVFLAFVAHVRIRRERERKNKALEYMQEVSRVFNKNKKFDEESLKDQFRSLYKARFETLNTLCLQFLETEGREEAEKIIYKQVWSIVEDVRNDKIRRARFEAILDKELDNIMTNVRNEMPKLKEVDFSMFAYLVAGFDLTTISRLLDMSLNNVYAHKRRLRLKIQDKQPLHAQHFLEMIS